MTVAFREMDINQVQQFSPSCDFLRPPLSPASLTDAQPNFPPGALPPPSPAAAAAAEGDRLEALTEVALRRAAAEHGSDKQLELFVRSSGFWGRDASGDIAYVMAARAWSLLPAPEPEPVAESAPAAATKKRRPGKQKRRFRGQAGAEDAAPAPTMQEAESQEALARDALASWLSSGRTFAESEEGAGEGARERGLDEDAVAALLTAYAVGMGLPVEGPADGPATQGGAEATRRWS